MTGVETFLACSAPFVLVALAWAAARRSSYHQGKSDAFQAVADDFTGLARATWWPKRKAAEQAAERKRFMLRLCLCDPRVCDALEAALVEAREHWGHPAAPPTGSRESASESVGTGV